MIHHHDGIDTYVDARLPWYSHWWYGINDLQDAIFIGLMVISAIVMVWQLYIDYCMFCRDEKKQKKPDPVFQPVCRINIEEGRFNNTVIGKEKSDG